MTASYRARLLAVGPLPARILIVSDAWEPQVNGVVRTLQTISHELRAMGHTVLVIGPDRFRTVPCPTYPDIRLSLFPARQLGRMIEGFAPDALHIATALTEGAVVAGDAQLIFVTGDNRQADAARAEGLEVLVPA